MNRPRVAVVDTIFAWPPSGGGEVDLKEILCRLGRDADVAVFVLSFADLWPGLRAGAILDRTLFYRKGEVDLPAAPFEVYPIRLHAASATGQRVGEALAHAVKRWRPDRVMVANGWHFKPHIVSALANSVEPAPMVRIYAHELLCIKGNGSSFRDGRPCPGGALDQSGFSHRDCSLCAISFLLGYPSPVYLHETLMSGALLPGFPDVVRHALGVAGEVLVSNERSAQRFRPFNSNVSVVPGGVDTALLRPQNEPSTPPHPNDQPIRIGHFGRCDDETKGFDVLLEACRILRKRGLPVKLLASNPPLEDEVVEAAPWVPPEKMARRYAEVDIVAIPSVWEEPFGLIALEAMSCRRPVVASRVGGLASLVRDGTDGLLVPPGEPEPLAEALQRLGTSPALRREMALAGEEKVRRHHDWEQVYLKNWKPRFC